MSIGVYTITCLPTGKQYVGSTRRGFNHRFNLHRSSLRRGKHQSPHLQHAWNKYGESAFVFKPLLICAEENTIFYEQRAMDAMKPAFNAIMTAGGGSGPKTDKVKQMISEAARARSRTYLVQGEYLSLIEVAEKYKISRATLKWRVRRGELEDALIAPRRAPKAGKGKLYNIRGQELDLTSISALYGVPRGTLDWRASKGWTGEELIQPVIDPEERYLGHGGRLQ